MPSFFNKYSLVFILSILNLCFVVAQNPNLPKLSDKAEFSLITCTPGNETYNIFGHSAIRLKDPKLNLDFVYNYGTFDFDTPDFILKFIQRKLLYSLSKSSYEPFQYVYIIEKRGVAEQVILIDSIQKQQLFDYLENNYLPQNREYLYDFFYDNCATRIRDVFRESFGKDAVSMPEINSNKTFRKFLDEYIQHDPWLNFGIDLILGLEADKICNFENQMFLPDYMALNLNKTLLNSKPMLSEINWILPKPEPKPDPSLLFSPLNVNILVLLISILMILFVKIEWLKKLWFNSILILLSFAGIFLLFMWIGTDHIATQYNMNVLWANPLFLIWLVVCLKPQNKRRIKIIGYSIFAINVFALLTFFLPIQEFNIAVFPLILTILLYFSNKLDIVNYPLKKVGE